MSLQHITGRKRIPNFAGLTTNRDLQLRIEEAEPNLGFPTEKTLPLKSGYYQLVTYDGGDVGERYWQTAPGTAVTGITLFDEGFIVGTGSSITNLNFSGVAIAATATNFDSIGYITVTPPGNNTEILFKENDDFSTSSAFTFNKFTDSFRVGVGGSVITALGDGRVGIRSASPERQLDIIGDLKLTGRLYDTLNRPGDNTDIITRVNAGGTDGIEWIARTSFLSGAAGTTGSIQFKGNTGLLDGVVDFIYDKTNEFVGIGTTIPRARLDIQTDNGTALIGDVISAGRTTTGLGLQFITDGNNSIFSGIFEEVENQILSLGANVNQVGIRTTTHVGGIVRIDTRPAGTFGDSKSFVVKGVSIGDTGGDEYSALVTDLDTGDTFLSPEKGAVAIGTEVISQKLNIAGYGITDNGIRIGDMHLFAFADTNADTKGSPTFKNLNTNGHSVLRIIPSGTGNSQVECFTQDYFANISTWDNFRIYTTPTYVRIDTSSATGSDGKPISIETNVSANGITRPNPNQLYLDTTGNVGINTGITTYALEVAGDIRLWEALRDNSGNGGGIDFVLQSTGGTSPRIKWTSLLSLTVGTAQRANTVRTIGISTSAEFYIPFVDDNNNPIDFATAYEGLYTNSNFKINPQDTSLNTGRLDFKGRFIIGDKIDIGTNLTNIADPTVTLGPSAFRALNIVDTNGVVKIARLTNDPDRDAAVDLQTYTEDGSSATSLWDLYGGVYGLGIRNLIPGNRFTGFFISSTGNVLINDSDTTPLDVLSQTINAGTDNKLQVYGDTYISGKVGIGTSSVNYGVSLVGDLSLPAGGIRDRNNSFGSDNQLLLSVPSGSSPSTRGVLWSPLSNTTVGKATSLATARNFSIEGDGDAPSVPFDGTDDVILNLTLDDTSVVAGIYGKDDSTFSINVDKKGRVLGITTLAINFDGAIAGRAKQIKTQVSSSSSTQYLTFVDGNNSATPEVYEDLSTNAAIQFLPSTETLSLSNANANSNLRGALWLNQTTGSILLDDSANSRISFGDGGGDFTIRGGNYNNGADEVYAKSIGAADGGASKISLDQTGADGSIKLYTATTGTPGSIVTYGVGIELSSAETTLKPNNSGVIDLGTIGALYNSVYANNFVGKVIGIADTAKRISIGRTNFQTDYFPAFTRDDFTTRNFTDLFTDEGFFITRRPLGGGGGEVVDIKTDGNLIAGRTRGGASLVFDDGINGSSITFNHTNQVPDVNGNSGRISLLSSGDAAMVFSIKSGVTAGGSVGLTSIAVADETGWLPGQDLTLHLGSPLYRWNNVYANSFNGTFVGTADTAKSIQVRELTSGTVVYPTFVDSNNSTIEDENLYTDGALKFNLNTNILEVPRFYATSGVSTFVGNVLCNNNIESSSLTVNNATDLKGSVALGTNTGNLITFNGALASSIRLNAKDTYSLGSNVNRFNEIYAKTLLADNLVGTSSSTDKIKIRELDSGINRFITFTTDNGDPVVGTALSVYTNTSLLFNADSDTLSVPALRTNTLTVDDSTTLGSTITADTVTFQSKIASNILPNSNVRDLGSPAEPWNNVYANNLVGTGATNVLVGVEDSSTTPVYLTYVRRNNTTAPQEEDFYTTSNISYSRTANILSLPNARFGGSTIDNLFIQNYAEKAVQSGGSTFDINLSNGNLFLLNFNSAATITINQFTSGFTPSTTVGTGLAVTLVIRNGANGQAINWPTNIIWPGGSVPSRTEDSGRSDVWVFISPNGGNSWYGNVTIFNL